MLTSGGALAARCLAAAVALVGLVAAPAQGQKAPDLVVSFPPERALVTKSDLPVEGYVTTRGIDEIEIIVNDGRPVRAVLRDGVFAEEVRLDGGQNEIRVGAAVRTVWLDDGREKPPPGYAPVYGHYGLSDACLECHTVGGKGVFTLAGEPNEICLWCHGDLVRGRSGAPWTSVHAPVRDGTCLGCHAAHTSAKKGLPAAKPQACDACHAAIGERLKTDRFVHGPMNLGDCRLCHAVHASEQPALLVRPATSLCTDCHSEALPPAGTPAALQPHTMIPQGRCGACHEPHSSANPRMLRQPAGRLCQGCHEGKTRSFHESKGFSIYVCAKCHDLHRPTQPHLIIDASRSLCTECHNFNDPAATFTHSFVAAGACFNCHSFHEASLPGDVATTCLGCHRDNPRLPGAHRGTAFERSRCTLCHQPHQARRGKLLREAEHPPFAARECDACHRERQGKVGAIYRSLCLDCHRELDLAAQSPAPVAVHPPFAGEDCGRCHASHNADAAGVLRLPQGRLCLDCHRTLRKAMLLTPPSAHTAFLEGRCGACHDPHFSQSAGLLRKPPAVLCVSCHAALVQGPEGAAWPVPHKPVAEGKCRLCHRPHTSNSADLLKSPLPQPCRPCHAKFFGALDEGAWRSRHQPVASGACGSCHAVHGGRAAALLREGAHVSLCRTCHPAPKGGHHLHAAAALAAADPGSRERGCLACHEPHASGQRRLLLPSSAPICRGCHKT
ncbi:MAG TPA: cytochrome c3 family protein [Candidatus Methanoperedens sp.]|nr:cytochrome c3 family protein [Candidatus Methanoperedens sp.]